MTKLNNILLTIIEYNNNQIESDKEICTLLMDQINNTLTESSSKIWHKSPVWFLDGNPIVGYSKQKNGIKLMFWSGETFEDKKLTKGSGKFKDAGIFYNNVQDIHSEDIKSWLEKSIEIQWDYKNIVKRKGLLVRLK